MLHEEIITIGDKEVCRHWSDTYTIRQVETGFVYEECFDVIPCPYHYEETSEFLPEPSEELIIDTSLQAKREEEALTALTEAEEERIADAEQADTAQENAPSEE